MPDVKLEILCFVSVHTREQMPSKLTYLLATRGRGSGKCHVRLGISRQYTVAVNCLVFTARCYA